MRRANLKYALIDLHERYPTWSALRLASELGCGAPYVRKAASRAGLVLRSANAVPQSRKMKLLPVPIPALPEWNERIAAR